MMQIDYLILALTNRCNLECAYCYNGKSRQKTDMDPDVLARAFALVASGDRPLQIQLTGGEPTLVPELIEQVVGLASGLGRPVSLAIQTNATCLTPELVDFFRNYSIQVGVSLDGPPGIQEKIRGKAADTLAGLKLLENGGVPFRVTTVVTGENTGHLEKLVLLLAGFGQARGIGLDLLVGKGRALTGNSCKNPDPRKLEKNLAAMAATLEAVNRHRSRHLKLRELDLVTAALAGRGKKAFCLAALGRSLAVDPRGRLYPCSQTMGDPAFEAGTVRQVQPQKLAGLKVKLIGGRNCHQCSLAANCPGDCPGRIFYNGPDHSGLACTMYRALIPLARKTLQPKVKQGEPT